MPVQVKSFRVSEAFTEELRKASPEVQNALRSGLNLLQQNASAASLRLHSLKGYPKPTLFKIDLFPDKSWQLTFEMDGTTAVLLRLGTHKQIDRRPR